MKKYQTEIPAFTLRETTVSDAPIIYHFIYELAIYEKMENDVIASAKDIETSIFIDHKAEVLLAMEDDVPIGIILFHENYSTFQGQANMYIEDIFISQPYRHRGYGTEIFKVIKSLAKARGYKRIDWVCLNWNTPSIKFYESMGAKALDEWILFRMKL